jgi:uncharacterized protein (DUF1786 family)
LLVILKIIALDIGAGTVDLLLYEDGRLMENNLKMVLPSPPRVYASMIRNATEDGRDVFLGGYTIGGGPLLSAIKNHLVKGLKVFMTVSAAYSLRNNLDEVRQIGVELADEVIMGSFEGESIFLDEILLNKYDLFLQAFGETLKDVDLVAISVKDHGAPPSGVSNREFRMQKFRELLGNDLDARRFLLKEKEIPDYFLRMSSSVRAAKSFLPDVDVVVMDTSPSALIGCMMDPRVRNDNPLLAVNVGNGHTMAAILNRYRICGLFEHHTGVLSKEKLEDNLIRFSEGELAHKEIFDEGGHGVLYFDNMPGITEIKKIAITGPRRSLLDNSRLNMIQAAPGGDVMMTGTIGIINAVISSLK